MDPRVYQQMATVEEHHWWFLGRRAVITAVLSSLPATGEDGNRLVFDAGCGSGGNLGVYEGFGSVIGVDTANEALAQARSRGYCGVSVASMAALPLRDAVFDLVAATDVVEHVVDPVGALQELLRVTRPGGHLLVTVPAYRWLWSESDVQLGHHRRYTKPQIVDECRAAGWLVARSSYFNSVLLPAIASMRWLRQRRGQPMAATELEQTGPWANRVLRLPMVAEARLVKSGVTLPAGVSIVCLAQRPLAAVSVLRPRTFLAGRGTGRANAGRDR